MSKILTPLQGMLKSLFRMGYILVFHGKRCENCFFWTCRRCGNPMSAHSNENTGPLERCKKWEKDII